MISKTFVITLERYKKEEIIKKKLENFNFDYEIFYGIDGKTIDKEEYNNYLQRRKSSHLLNTHQLGNTLSHIKLYEKILEEKHDEVLILEDDFIFTPHVSLFEEYYSQLPNNFDIFFLGLNNIHNIYDEFLTANFSKNLYKSELGDTLEGTHALVMKRKFIENIYEYQKYMLWTDDGSLSEYQKLHEDVNYFVAIPQLIKTEKCIWKI